jgi:hypothetical protein
MQVPFFDGNISASLLVGTRRVGFLRGAGAAGLPQKNCSCDQTKSAYKAHETISLRSAVDICPV